MLCRISATPGLIVWIAVRVGVDIGDDVWPKQESNVVLGTSLGLLIIKVLA